jgi:hypothetical protein
MAFLKDRMGKVCSQYQVFAAPQSASSAGSMPRCRKICALKNTYGRGVCSLENPSLFCHDAPLSNHFRW